MNVRSANIVGVVVSLSFLAIAVLVLVSACGPDIDDLNEMNRLHDSTVAAYYRGDYERAVELGEKALEIAESQINLRRPIAISQDVLAKAHDKLGNYDLADSLFAESLHLYAQAAELGDPRVTSLDIAEFLSNYGRFCSEQKRYPEAESLLIAAVIVFKSTDLAESAFRYALTLSELGIVYDQTNRQMLALPTFGEAIEVWRKYKPGNPNLSYCLHSIAAIYSDLGKVQEAESLSVEALQIAEAALDSTHWLFLKSMAGLAGVLGRSGKHDKALPVWERAVRLSLLSEGDTSSLLAHYRSELGSCYLQLGKINKAEPLILSGLQQLETQTEDDDPRLARAIMRLGQLRTKEQRGTEAESLLVQAVEVAEVSPGVESRIVYLTQEELASFYLETNQNDKAVSALEELVATTEKVYGISHPKTARALLDYASALRRVSRGGQAEVLERRANYILSRQ